jgi:uncharacterized protein (DUF885 family)
MTEDDRAAARRLAERFWEGYLELEPTVATAIGDERYDDRLPDPSEAGRSAKQVFYRGAMAELGRIERAGLDAELRIALDTIEAASGRELDALRLRLDRLSAASHVFGAGTLLADLGSIQRADTPERTERYLRRLEASAGYLDALREVCGEGARGGVTQPRLVVDRLIAQIGRQLDAPVEDSAALAVVQGGSPETKERTADVLRRHVWPAYGRLLETLRSYREAARDSLGLGGLAGGDEMYAAEILAYTTLPLPAQEVHDIGQAELAKIQEERREIAARLGHPDAESAIAALTAGGGNVASSREEMLKLVEDQVRRSWEAAPGWFGRLPGANCEVKPVEEFRETDMPGAFYVTGTPDGSRLGVYYVNTGGLDQRPLYATATTSFHEANPGHHFQLTLEQEFTDRLPIRRFSGMLGGGSFIEGWALYCERLADEMGMFLDEHERLGMLEADAFRAARLIVDTGIHALGWDRERAVRQMQATGAPRQESEIEVDRYIAWPGQACSYKIGELEILRWREAERSRLGAAFDIRSFHDRLLSLGSLPLPTLERELTVPD